ncbi:putative Amino acid transporter AVT3B [Cocos nucifera]|nr:putative Amino acid transporter AVT3B [Cocos nucifera]
MVVVPGEDVAAFLALRAVAGPSVLFYGAGVAIYAFEGNGMVLPLEAEAADKSKFGKTLGLSIFLIALRYGLFNVLGYLARRGGRGGRGARPSPSTRH